MEERYGRDGEWRNVKEELDSRKGFSFEDDRSDRQKIGINYLYGVEDSSLELEMEGNLEILADDSYLDFRVRYDGNPEKLEEFETVENDGKPVLASFSLPIENYGEKALEELVDNVTEYVKGIDDMVSDP